MLNPNRCHVVPPLAKPQIIDDTKKAVNKVENLYNMGLYSAGERYKKVVDLWNEATEKVADAMMTNLEQENPFNPIYMMADSGARGNKQQMRQLAGMRGLMADPSGKIIDLPITANFREGLSVSDYFISSHGARKGLADTALRTADSGYLTRRLVDVAQDVIVREEDCDVSQINLKLERALLANETFDALEILSEALIGRVLASPIVNPTTKDIVIKQDTILDEKSLEIIGELNIREISIRGRSLTAPNSSSHSLVNETIKLGTPSDIDRERLRHNFIHEIEGKELAKDIEIGDDKYTAGTHLTHAMLDRILDSDAGKIFVRNNNVRGIEVEAITEGSGVIESLEDRIVGRVLAEDIFDSDGNKIASINDDIDKNLAKKIADVRNKSHNKKVKIRSVLTCKSQFGVCIKCYGSDLANQAPVEIGEAVGIIAAQSIGEPGTQLTMRTFHTGGVAGGDDITQGLPRVEELFEARKPKHNAIISEISGKVSFGENEKKQRVVTVTSPNTMKYEYAVPLAENEISVFDQLLLVQDGEEISAGTKIAENVVAKNDGVVTITEQTNDTIVTVTSKSGAKQDYIIPWNFIKQMSKGGDFSINEGDKVKMGEKFADSVNADIDGTVYIDDTDKDNRLVVSVVASPERAKYDILTEFDGDVFVKNGERVKKGARLTEIYTAEIDGEVSIDEKEQMLTVTSIRRKYRYSVPSAVAEKVTATSANVKAGDNITANITSELDGEISINTNERTGRLIITVRSHEETYDYSMPLEFENRLVAKDGDEVNAGDAILNAPADGIPAVYEIGGEISLNRESEKLVVTVRSPARKCEYIVPLKPERKLSVESGDKVKKGDKLIDAVSADVDGEVTFVDNDDAMVVLVLTGEPFHHDDPIPFGSRLAEFKPGLQIREGAYIKAGMKIIEGAINPHDILKICGLKETQRYLVYEVQKVYKSQGVEINDKHIEVMVRQMLHKVKIEESGSTEFLPGEFIDINVFEAANTKAIEEGKEPAVARPILLGITKASLATDSFLSAASFQETTKVLTEAAIKGKIDPLIGLKENVIIGKLIPAGTGMPRYRDLQVVDKAAQ